MQKSIFPLTIIAGVALGFVSAEFFPIAPVVLYASAIGIVVAWWHCPVRFSAYRRPFLVALFLCIGLWRGSMIFLRDMQMPMRHFLGTGVVTAPPAVREKSQAFTLEITPSVAVTLGVITGLYPRYAYGDLLSIECPKIQDGICVFPKLRRMSGEKGNALLTALYHAKDFMVSRLGATMSEPEASFAAALLLGERATMPKDFRDALQITGTTHIVAVSGMQVVLFTGIIQALLGMLPLSIHLRRGIAAFFVIFFTVMIGAPASAVRGLAFGLLLLLAESVGRPRQMSIVLATTCAGLLLLYPPFLFDAGFYLSFLAVIGIVYGVPVLTRVVAPYVPPSAFFRGIVALVLVTGAATITTAPFIAFVFGRVSFVGIIVNLLVVPLVEVATILTLGVVVLALVHPIIAFPFGAILSFVLTLIMKIIYIFALFPGASVRVASSSPLLLLIIYTVLFSALFFYWSRLTPWERSESIQSISPTA